MSNNELRVHEWLFKHYGCSESLLADLARDEQTGDTKGYWISCERFVERNSGAFVSSLSPREFAWLEKIRDSLLRLE